MDAVETLLAARSDAGRAGAVEADLAAGEVVHLWLNAARPGDSGGTVAVSRLGENGSAVVATLTTDGPSDDFVRAVFRAERAGRHRLSWDESTTAVSLAYAFDPVTVLRDGVRPLRLTDRNRLPDAGPRFHFRPPWGWMNDPNGLCQVGEDVHLFYQHYPHSLRWNTMHWGHAVTRDGGLTWTHLPIFLRPRDAMTRSDAKRGGAFSGSAIARPGGTLRVFHTDREDGRAPAREWQVTATAADGVEPDGPAVPVIDRRPDLPGFGDDFRDPYVFRGPDGRWKMLVGGRDADGGVVVLYGTDDTEGSTGWRLLGLPFRAPAGFGDGPCECPCMVELEGEGAGLWALFVGLLRSRDPETGRRNLSLAAVGRFDGSTFVAVRTRELDIGGDCYAFQAFASPSGPRGLAWAANWTEINRQADFPSAMTLLRRVEWSAERGLLTPPVDDLARLRAEPLPTPSRAGPAGTALPGGCAEYELGLLRPGAPFTLRLLHPDLDLVLVQDGNGVELIHRSRTDRARPGAAPRHRAAERARDLRLFVDVGLVEVFVNGGALCFTKRLDTPEPVAALVLEVDPADVERETLWRLDPPDRAEQPGPDAPAAS